MVTALTRIVNVILGGAAEILGDCFESPKDGADRRC